MVDCLMHDLKEACLRGSIIFFRLSDLPLRGSIIFY